MHNYKIKKNIEIPAPFVPSGYSGVTLLKYPWPYMDSGDCFDIPTNGKKESNKRGTTAQSSGISWCKRNRPGYTVRYRSYDRFARVWMMKKTDV